MIAEWAYYSYHGSGRDESSSHQSVCLVNQCLFLRFLLSFICYYYTYCFKIICLLFTDDSAKLRLNSNIATVSTNYLNNKNDFFPAHFPILADYFPIFCEMRDRAWGKFGFRIILGVTLHQLLRANTQIRPFTRWNDLLFIPLYIVCI